MKTLFTREQRILLREGAGRITGAALKKALNAQSFRADSRNQGLVVRSADVLPGVSVHEYSKAKLVKGLRAPTAQRHYKVNVYQGSEAASRWKTLENASLETAVEFINQNADAAAQHWHREMS